MSTKKVAKVEGWKVEGWKVGRVKFKRRDAKTRRGSGIAFASGSLGGSENEGRNWGFAPDPKPSASLRLCDKNKHPRSKTPKLHAAKATTALCLCVALAMLLAGCAGLDQADHQTSTTVWAIGVPGVAILRDSRVQPDNRGTSTTTATQVNTLDVEPKVK